METIAFTFIALCFAALAILEARGYLPSSTWRAPRDHRTPAQRTK